MTVQLAKRSKENSRLCKEMFDDSCEFEEKKMMDFFMEKKPILRLHDSISSIVREC